MQVAEFVPSPPLGSAEAQPPRGPLRLLQVAFGVMPVSSALAGVLVLIAALRQLAWARRERLAPLAISRLWLALLGAIVLSCVLSSHPEISWVSIPLSGAYLLAIWVVARTCNPFERVRLLLATFFWSTLPWCFVAMAIARLHIRGVWHWGPVQLEMGTQDDRAVAIFGNPNFLAGYLLMALAAGLAIARGRWRWYLPALAVMLACLVMTESRAAWIGAGALGLVWFSGWSAGSARRLRLGRWAMGGLAGVAACVFATSSLLRDRLLTLTNPAFVSNLDRERVWRSAIEMIHVRPIFGWGPGTWYKVYPAFRDPAEFEHLTHAHSVYLQIGVEYGLVVLALLLALFFEIVWKAFRTTRGTGAAADAATALAAAIVGYMTMGLFDFTLSEGRNSIAFFTTLGLLVALSTQASRTDPAVGQGD